MGRVECSTEEGASAGAGEGCARQTSGRGGLAARLQVLRLHTDFREQFANDIQHDLTYNLREGFEQDDDEVLLHRSRLPSISEQSDGSAEREVSVRSPIPRCSGGAGGAEAQITRIKTEMSTLMGRLEKLSETSSARPKSGHVGNSETASKSVQTDFPVSLLESYVVKNRSRILTLLNISEPGGTSGATSLLTSPACSPSPPSASRTETSPLLSNGSCPARASLLNEKKVAVTDF